MFCKHCGSKLDDGTNFCPNCGADLRENRFDKAVNDISNKVDSFSQKVDSQVDAAIDGVQKDMGNNSHNGEYERLTTDRSLLAYVLLTLITCGIYGYYFIYKLAKDINVACADDGERTPGLATYIIFSFLTCGFYDLYWEYKIANRIADNGPKYDISFSENGSSVLLWRIFGSLICLIGTFVGVNILITNANRICKAYNDKHNV